MQLASYYYYQSSFVSQTLLMGFRDSMTLEES